MKKNLKTVIIAEIGVNHNGILKNAKSLALKSKKIGADIVKFQLYNTDLLATKKLGLSNYQSKNLNTNISQYKMLKKYEISFKDANELIKFCKKNSIKITFSCFDEKSLEIFNSDYVKYIKIPSGEINNNLLLKKISFFKKKIILSIGNSSENEIKNAIKILNKNFKKEITILHCVSDYPASNTEMNLKTITYLKNKFNYNIGLSDHSSSIEIPSIATALGATMIEKHITENNYQKGPDHKASLDIENFKKMILKIRDTEIILGKEQKIISKGEQKNKNLVRKFVVAKSLINKGDKFSQKNITTKRSGGGIPANLYFTVIGKKAKKKFNYDDKIIL